MILVTGAKGFIGTRLCAELERQNVPYFAYDLVDGFDIRNKFQLAKVIRENNIDAIYHLAALAGVRTSEEFPDEYIQTNVQGTYNVVWAAKKYGVKRLISFSSSSVYGDQQPPNKENAPYAPKSVYGMTKVAGELIALNSGIATAVIRPFTVYGENGRKDQVIIKWINQAKAGLPITVYGEGETKRGYTYVGDLVEGVLRADGYLRNEAFAQKPPAEVFNLGGSEVISLGQLAKIFDEYLPGIGMEILPIPAGDVNENWADASKARAMLHWEPQSNFEDNVRKIITKHYHGRTV